MTDPREFKLGALRDPVDSRDFQLTQFVRVEEIVLPPKLSYRSQMTPVKNQGQLGSCVAFGCNAANEYFQSFRHHRSLDFSEQQLYGNCKQQDGVPHLEGTYPRVALSILNKTGVCEEQYFPYEGKYPPSGKPRSGADANAKQFTVDGYASVGTDLQAIKVALYKSGPVPISVDIYDSFYDCDSRKGMVPMPSSKYHGGHLMLAVGYDDTLISGQTVITCKNSWGTWGGDAGYIHISSLVWEKIGISAWSIVNHIVSVDKHWPDWPDEKLLEQDIVFRKGLLKGHKDGNFYPGNKVRQRHVQLVLNRLDPSIAEPLSDEGWKYATRGWVRDTFPDLDWEEERWSSSLTRFQFTLLVARYVIKGGM